MLRWLKIFLCLCILLSIGKSALAQTPAKVKKLPESEIKIISVNETVAEDTGNFEITENSLAKSGKSVYISTNNPPNRVVSTVASWDFTTGSDKYYGGATGAKEIETGVWGMIAGDADGNGEVQANDKENYWSNDVGTSGYKGSDFNLNGEVQADDKENYWRLNAGRGTQVP